MSAVKISNLQFCYQVNSSLVIDIDEWQLAVGERCFLYGASGSGKTTLLNLLGGVLEPTHGRINILGTELTGLSSRKKDQFRAKHIGMVFQQFNLVPYLNVLENIQLAAHFAGQNQAKTYQKARQLFDRLKLNTELLTQRADSLSVGQQQRVAIARALINSPAIIIADEPTSALDSDTRDSFMSLLLETIDTDTSLIFVSHDKSLQSFFGTSANLLDLNRQGVADAD